MLLIIKGILIVVCLIYLGCHTYAFGNNDIPAYIQETDDLEAFLEDPVANFDRLKAIPNLCDRVIQGYELKRAFQGPRGPRPDFLDLLFSRHFQEFDEKKIEIVIYLNRNLWRCYGKIWEKTGMIFGLQPEMFVRVLEHEAEWRDVIDGLSLKWESFSAPLRRLGDSGFEREVKDYAFSIHGERDQKINIIKAFLCDPVLNFEKTKSWDDICSWIYRYGEKIKKDGYSIMSCFLETHFEEVDEKKIEILIHMVPLCWGEPGPLLSEKTARIFGFQTQLFIKVLERSDKWKEVIDKISMMGWGDFSRGLLNLGDTEFEKKIKKHVEERRAT